MSRKILLALLICGAVLLVGGTAQAASSTLTASQTVAAAADAVDNTALATSTTQANVAQIRATTTMDVALATPLASTTDTLTIGTCVITFASTTAGVVTASAYTDDTSCADNSATIYIHTVTGTATTTRTAAQIATAIVAIDNIYDTNHGWLTSLASTTNTWVAFGATSTLVTSATQIASSTTATGKIVGLAAGTVAPVVAVAMTQTITVGGTISANNTYTIRSNGISASYTALTTDTTAANIATGLNTALTTAGPTEYTNAVSTSVITLTAVTAGTAFSPATTTMAKAQTVTFTPANVTVGETFKVVINGTTYSYKASGADGTTQVINGLVAAITSDAVNCSASGSTVSCSARTTGTAFTYSSSVDGIPSSSGGGGGGGGAPYVAPPVVTPPNAPVVLATLTLTKTLSYGRSNKEVKLLQEKLKLLGFMKASQRTTNYFGVTTKKALIKFQMKNKLRPYNGVLNKKTRALLNSL